MAADTQQTTLDIDLESSHGDWLADHGHYGYRWYHKNSLRRLTVDRFQRRSTLTKEEYHVYDVHLRAPDGRSIRQLGGGLNRTQALELAWEYRAQHPDGYGRVE